MELNNFLLLAFSLFMNLLSGAFIRNDFCKNRKVSKGEHHHGF